MRKATLWSVPEIAEMLNMSTKTIQRRIAQAEERGTAYSEPVHSGGKGRPVRHFDLLTLGLAVPNPDVPKMPLIEGVPKIGIYGTHLQDTSAFNGHPPSEPSQTAESPISSIDAPAIYGTQNLSNKSPITGHIELSQIVRTDPAILLDQARGGSYQDTNPGAARELHAVILPVLTTRPGT